MVISVRMSNTHSIDRGWTNVEFFPVGNRSKRILSFDNHSVSDQRLLDKVKANKRSIHKEVKYELYKRNYKRHCLRCGLSLVENIPFFDLSDPRSFGPENRYYLYDKCPLCGKEYQKIKLKLKKKEGLSHERHSWVYSRNISLF